MTEAHLQVEGLVRRYGRVSAVNGLNLSITAGSFVTLLGPSGCGKSTTLNLIAGLDIPDEGKILLGGRDITRLPPNERGMAMVFQNYALYPNMDVADNVGFSLRLQRRPRSEISRRVKEVAEALDIGHLLQRRPGQLSGGQQQRVALGRALVKHPEVFLLDEPFSNLDAGLRARMRAEVKHLHLTLGTTSIFVTHDQEEAMALSDTLVVMSAGSVVQSGTQQEIYGRPRNLYVATFVGKPRMSLIEGTLQQTADQLALVGEGLRIPLGSPGSLKLVQDAPSDLTLGFRAEDVRIVSDSAAGAGSFPAVVRLVEPMGSDTFVELEIGAATLVARVTPDLNVVIGQKVCVDVAPGRIHVFDTSTGNRVLE
jgi:multiple sugar transport system ATP-binding protein